MSNQDEVAQTLEDLSTQLDKVKSEILAATQHLEDEIAALNAGVNPRIDAAVANLKTKIQGLDDLNADAAPAETE